MRSFALVWRRPDAGLCKVAVDSGEVVGIMSRVLLGSGLNCFIQLLCVTLCLVSVSYLFYGLIVIIYNSIMQTKRKLKRGKCK